MLCCSSPQGGKTTNWRAGCGKSASPVRREGRRKPMRCSYPYRNKGIGSPPPRGRRLDAGTRALAPPSGG